MRTRAFVAAGLVAAALTVGAGTAMAGPEGYSTCDPVNAPELCHVTTLTYGSVAPGEYMQEDQSPLAGLNGGRFVNFVHGIAYYSDHTDTNGNSWDYWQ